MQLICFFFVYIHNYVIAWYCLFLCILQIFVHHKIYQRIPVLMMEDIFNQFSFWRTIIACQSQWTKIPVLSYNANLRHHHQDNLTHRKKPITGVIQKTLENITQNDITKVCQEVLKPVAELTNKTKDQECLYDNFYIKIELVNINSQEFFITSVFDLNYSCRLYWFDIIWCCATKLFTFHSSNHRHIITLDWRLCAEQCLS